MVTVQLGCRARLLGILVLVMAAADVAVAAPGATAPPLRSSVDLDGAGWALELDPTDSKVLTMAANGSKVAMGTSEPFTVHVLRARRFIVSFIIVVPYKIY